MKKYDVIEKSRILLAWVVKATRFGTTIGLSMVNTYQNSVSSGKYNIYFLTTYYFCNNTDRSIENTLAASMLFVKNITFAPGLQTTVSAKFVPLLNIFK